MYSVTPALSFTGDVFGIHATAVKPPATAAAVPVATVSLCSCPGSRRCTCISINPGQTISPFDNSTIVASSAGRSWPMRPMRWSSIRMSNEPSRPFAGSTMRAPLSSRFGMTPLFDAASQQVQHRHPYGHAVGYLFEDHGVRTIGDLGRDLDAAIHRTGMHDDHVALGSLDPIGIQAEHVKILPQRREVRALHPLLLDAQHHDDVGVGHRFVDGGRYPHAQPLNPWRHQRRWSGDPDFGAELAQEQDVRPKHATVQQIADDRDLQTVEAFLMLADREGIEQ